MAKMEAKWVKLKVKRRGKDRYGLRCTKCENRLLLVVDEGDRADMQSFFCEDQ